MKKKIVILRSNPVDPDPRVEKEAEALIEAGFQVFVLCWNRECNSGYRKEHINIKNRSVEVIRIGCKASFGDGMKNVFPFLRFQIMIGKYLLKNRDRYDVIHACDFDTAFTANIISRLLKKKLVFDIFDFIFGNPENLFQKLIKNLQLYIINSADATIICSEKRKLQIQGSRPKRLTIIHNTPQNQLVCMEEKKEERKDNKRTRLVYVGVLQEFRLIKETLECVSKLQNVELHIGGFGKYENYVKKYSKKNDNIFYYGRISYESTLELEKNADIMLALYDPIIENHIYAAPNKFYEGLMLGKPLIMVKGSGMSEIVEQNNIGVLIECSEEGVKSGVQDLIERQHEWDGMKMRMQQLYKDRYSWDIMKSKLINLYEHI